MSAINLLFANNAQTTIAGSIGPSSVVVNLAAGGGSLFPNPNPSNNEYFVGTLTDAATGVLREIVWCTARSGDSLTIVRAREGTAAQSWAANDLFAELWTAGQAANLVQVPAAQAGSWNFGEDTGAVNAYVCALTPAVPSAPASGFVVRLLADNTNTAASTLNAGWGAVAIKRRDGSALIGGEVQAAHFNDFEYNAVTGFFEVMQPAPATAAAITAGTDTFSYVTPAQLNAALGTAKLLSGQVYFSRTNATSCKLSPFNGNIVPVAGVNVSIAAAGISVANTNISINGVGGSTLANNTGYLVAFNGTTLEFWTLATGHSTDTTAGNVGVEVITGNVTKTLVGQVRTDGSGEFVNTAGSIFLLSWFNRKKQVSKTNFTGNPALSADAAPAELSNTIRNSFIVWAGDVVDFRNSGSVTAINSNQLAMTGIGFDGTTAELESTVFAGMNTNTEGGSYYGSTDFSGEKTGLAEGNHYATLLGSTYNYAGNNAVWQGGTTTFSGVGPARPPNTLTIVVMG